MEACCEEMAQLQGEQRRVLWIVCAINAVMFGVEFVSGWVAHSSALTSDSLEMLGDALLYAMSLYALGRGVAWQTGVSFAKGAAMLALGLTVVAQIGVTLVLGHRPQEGWMGAVGALALAANLACLWLLTHHRRDDLNLRSAWTCARNDVLSNIGVLVAAAGVAVLGSAWPDAIVGGAIAALVLTSAVRVLRDSVIQWRGGTVVGLDDGHGHGHDHGHAHAHSHHHHDHAHAADD
jgi:cation diffusion facilitator family transporter